MTTRSRGVEGAMEESTIERKSDAVSTASIASAVVSSVRRDLLSDKSKCGSEVLLSATDRLLGFLLFSF